MEWDFKKENDWIGLDRDGLDRIKSIKQQEKGIRKSKILRIKVAIEHEVCQK